MLKVREKRTNTGSDLSLQESNPQQNPRGLWLRRPGRAPEQRTPFRKAVRPWRQIQWQTVPQSEDFSLTDWRKGTEVQKEFGLYTHTLRKIICK